MKRFRSRIESLKRVREQAEQLARLQAAVCRQEKNTADDRVAGLSERLAAVAAEGPEELSRGRVEIMQAIMNSTARLEAERRVAVAEQTVADLRLQQAVQQVADAKTELKTAETHIEKEWTEHRRKSRIEEENQRHEDTARRFTRP